MPTDPTFDEQAGSGLLDTLLLPLRLPQRALAEIEGIGVAVRALSHSATERLTSVDDRAGQLVDGLRSMNAALVRLERKVETLMTLEETVDHRMESVREDLNTRMLAVEEHVRSMQRPLEQIARDVAKIDELLPDPSSGPLTRLRETLTSSG